MEFAHCTRLEFYNLRVKGNKYRKLASVIHERPFINQRQFFWTPCKSVFKSLMILNNFYFYQKLFITICMFALFRFISSCFFHIKGNNPLKMNESTFVLLYHLYWEWVQRYQIWQMCRYQAAPSQFFRLESFSIPSSSITNYRPRRYLHSENRCSGVEKEALCKRNT